ncbi:MAG: hypothetical protein BGO95_09855 [Micrococcales bacterium 73-13]|nr:MAG: hypothetical protein BGO95_09855 [Micrococcales bacterium 73-13]
MDGKTAVLDAPAGRRPPSPWWLWGGAAVAVLAGIVVVVLALLGGRAVGVLGAGGAAGPPAGPLAGDAATALAAAIDQGSALAAATTADQLADPQAYSALLGALVEAGAVGTPAGAEAARGRLLDAIDRVTRSRSAKALSDAQTDLSAVIGTAVQVNADTEGRVSDDGLRVELQARIDAARALLAGSAVTVDDVVAGTRGLTDQTAAVLAARLLGFREAEGRWCASDGSACLAIAWPEATLPGGDVVRLAGGETAIGDCYQTDEFRSGRSSVALLYCAAGAAIPDGRKAVGSVTGDPTKDRLWVVSEGRLSDLRYRAAA